MVDDAVGFLAVPVEDKFWVKVGCRPEAVKSNSDNVLLRCCGTLMEAET